MFEDDKSTAVVLDPEAVRVGRVARSEFSDDLSRLVFTFEGEDYDFRIALLPEPALAMLIGLLDGLGYPQQDIEYLADRWRREFA